MNPAISDAIRNRKVLRLTYNWGYREVEPHCYGVNDNGHELLRCYQTSGDSKSNEPQGWKIFRVDEITQIAATQTSFAGPRPDYRPGDKAMTRQIYCQL